MAEFDDKLNALLSNPDAMSQIMQLANSLSGDSDTPSAPAGPAPPAPPASMAPRPTISPPARAGRPLRRSCRDPRPSFTA